MVQSSNAGVLLLCVCKHHMDKLYIANSMSQILQRKRMVADIFLDQYNDMQCIELVLPEISQLLSGAYSRFAYMRDLSDESGFARHPYSRKAFLSRTFEHNPTPEMLRSPTIVHY